MKNQGTSRIREYTLIDREAVLALFRLNTPEFFDPAEENHLIHYLENEREEFFVIENEEIVVGCGGINFEDEKRIGKLSWDFLHPSFHGYGLGTMLLQYRIDLLKENKSVRKIIVRTSQMACAFYGKNGFIVLEKKKDYWAPGFDLVLMELAKDTNPNQAKQA